jgi:hypothetical protein
MVTLIAWLATGFYSRASALLKEADTLGDALPPA